MSADLTSVLSKLLLPSHPALLWSSSRPSRYQDIVGLFPNMQLEQGLCVLAGKLISLGLNDLAYKELRLLSDFPFEM
jgi:hypothetical protein